MIKSIYPDTSERGKPRCHIVSKNNIYNNINYDSDIKQNSKTFFPTIGVTRRYSGMKVNVNKSKEPSQKDDIDKDIESDGPSM